MKPVLHIPATLCAITIASVLPLFAQTVAFDLGLTFNTEADENGTFWNKIGTWQVYKKENNVDTENHATTVTWETVSPLSFHYKNHGIESTLGYPDFVSQDGLDLLRGGTVERTKAEIILSGLEPNTFYDLLFYASARIEKERDSAMEFLISDADGKQHKNTLYVSYDDSEAEMTLANVKSDIEGALIIKLFLLDGYNYGNWSALKIFPSNNDK